MIVFRNCSVIYRLSNQVFHIVAMFYTVAGIINLFQARESLVSDIPAGDGKIAYLFFYSVQGHFHPWSFWLGLRKRRAEGKKGTWYFLYMFCFIMLGFKQKCSDSVILQDQVDFTLPSEGWSLSQKAMSEEDLSVNKDERVGTMGPRATSLCSTA